MLCVPLLWFDMHAPFKSQKHGVPGQRGEEEIEMSEGIMTDESFAENGILAIIISMTR